MSELPAWVDPAQMQLDTRFDAQGRWVSGPVNDTALPKPVATQPRDIVVRDDTLRSGGNTPGVYASDADHILATRFLKRFAGEVPWIHVDLSGSSCKGGLGAVASDVTGFGVAWGMQLLDTLTSQ